MAERTAERWAQVDQSAPTFTLPAADGSAVALEDFRGKHPVVLVFYRGWW